MPRKKEPTCVTEKYTFPTQLRELMESNKTTQKKLADAIDMRPQTVSLYTTGQSFPDVNTLKKIAEFFNVSADYLLGLIPTPTTDIEDRAVEEYTGLSHSSIRWLHLRRKEEIVHILNSLMEHTDFRIALENIIELKHTAPFIPQDSCIFPPPIEKRSNYVMINRETYTELLEYKITEALKRAFKEVGYSDVDFSAVIGKELID